MLVCVKCNWWRGKFFPLLQAGAWSAFSKYCEPEVSIGVWQTVEAFSPKKFPCACCCLLSATCAAITRCLSTTSKQQGQRQSFHAHDLLWPFKPEITPWFLHLAHFGLLKRCSVPEFIWLVLPFSVFILNRSYSIVRSERSFLDALEIMTFSDLDFTIVLRKTF